MAIADRCQKTPQIALYDWLRGIRLLVLDFVLVLFLDELGLPKEPVGLLRRLIFLPDPMRNSPATYPLLIIIPQGAPNEAER